MEEAGDIENETEEEELEKNKKRKGGEERKSMGEKNITNKGRSRKAVDAMRAAKFKSRDIIII